MTNDRLRSRRGGIVAIVMGALVFIGLLLAIQSSMVLSLGSVSRACDDFRQTTTDDRRFENIVREATLALRGTTFTRSANTISQEIDQKLGSLNDGLDPADPRVAQLSAAPTLPDLGMFPDPVFPPLQLAPSDLQNLAQPEIMRLAGPLVAVSSTFNFDFQRGHVFAGNTNSWGTRITARLVQAPLTRHSIVSYVFPREVGAPNFAPNPLPSASPLPGGLIPSLDPAYVGDLRSANTLPIHFRNRAALATAYQYVFSNGYFQRVINTAGVTHVADLDVGAPLYPALTGSSVPVLNPDLSGVSEPVTGQEFVIDLANVGTGTRLITATTYTENKNVLVLFTRAVFPSKTVRIVDSGTNNDPLLLVLAGGTDGAAAQLLVNIESTISRPVVIVCYNARVGATGGNQTMQGALLLDPRSSVDTSAGMLHLAHVSYYAFSSWVSASSFVVDQTMPQSAANLAPRVVYVATGASRL